MYVGAGVSSGDEIICPAYTFYATVTPLFFIGALPILCDCDDSGNMDLAKIQSLITSKTKGIVVTHMWGVPAKIDEIRRICDKYKLMLFEDCSHAHGAKYNGYFVGKKSDASVWSLQGQKILTGGEGGILLTDNKNIYDRALLLGHYNKRCKQEIFEKSVLYKYAVTGMGLKFRSHPLAIAVANEQFNNLDVWLTQKRYFADLFNKRLSKLPGIRIPKVDLESEPSWYAYVLQYVPEELDNLPIDKFYDALIAEGCSELDRPGSTCPLNTLSLFQNPSELFPYYKGIDRVKYKEGDFPVAENFYENALKLPVWVNKEDIKIVEKYIEAIEKVINNYKQLIK